MAGIDNRIKAMTAALSDKLGPRDKFFLIAYEEVDRLEDLQPAGVQVMSNLDSVARAVKMLEDIIDQMRQTISTQRRN